MTYYSAEFINTLTNLMFIYLAYEGVKSCRKHGHDTVFEVAYFGYFLVGFGSFMFHSTLKCMSANSFSFRSTLALRSTRLLNWLLTNCRPVATSRRTQHDLHHLPDGLRKPLLLPLRDSANRARRLPNLALRGDHGILPLRAGPNISPERLRRNDGLHCLPKHLPYGIHTATVLEEKRGETPQGARTP